MEKLNEGDANAASELFQVLIHLLVLQDVAFELPS